MYQFFNETKINDIFIITDKDYHHIKNVIKLKVNENVIIVFKEKKYLCKIIEFNNSECIVKIIDEIISNASNININLFLGVIREQKWDYALQKSTEIGVSNIYPVIFKRNVVKINNKDEEKKLIRWQSIVNNAAKQAKVLNIPNVKSVIYNVNDIIKQKSSLNLLCYENEEGTTLKNVLKGELNCKNINLIIGPEGGLDESEVIKLNNNGFKSVSLGNNILRAETAPLFALSCIKYEFDM
ncbi:RsmE family RNA methyltransferase [Spiroplasma turonicum]|uniref:Ribosomal RNA small subunit methyltransferase E n=1 Tax=Spiroplasma turonicum TaxID=216946 RepID=A0A0K1P5Q2_9MOLU|nr:RsmE family RNA methyltransferase [Spiroplasma turonicum]AKU79580.1 16S ribosomal RNA methyltransferase RsmE [Spiroplasma turonicum]ALX70602.1 16S rRNA (uracil1498-N3)-methyltransferase [Spiroplasma turonicum]